jgi:hypothetical protein
VFLIIKPTICTNFSNLFWKWNSTCFGQFLCPSSAVIHCTFSNGICHRGLQTAFDQDWTAVPSLSCCCCCCSKAVYKPVQHIPLLNVQWIAADDGQRNCPKHVEFHFQNKFEKLVHLVGLFYKEICHDARSRHDARSDVTMHGHMNVKITKCSSSGRLVPYMQYQIHPDIDRTAYKDAWKNTIQLHVQVFLRMKLGCSKHVEDTIIKLNN